MLRQHFVQESQSIRSQQCNIEELFKQASNYHQTRYKSFPHLFLITLNLSLGSFYSGYSSSYMSSIDFLKIAQIYSISIQISLAQGLVFGMIPFGACIGSLLSILLLQCISRRLILINLLALIVTPMLLIQNVYVFFIMRFFQGLCVGFYTSITPLIIKQTSPIQISGILGSLTQFLMSFGVFMGFTLQYLLSNIFTEEQDYWRILICFPILIIGLQLFIIVFIYPYQTPKFLLLNENYEEARNLISEFYYEEFIQAIFQQKENDIIKIKSKQNQSNDNRKSSKMPIFLAINLSLLKQFMGITAIISYGPPIAGQIFPSLKQIVPIIINFQQVVAVSLSFYFIHKFGRKNILQIGTINGALALGFITFGFWFRQQYQSEKQLGSRFVLVGLIIFMANFGFTIGPAIWLYIPEFVQPNIVIISTMFNWLSATLTLILFPILTEMLPKKNPALLFLFCLFYTALSGIIHQIFLVETRNKTQKQIQQLLYQSYKKTYLKEKKITQSQKN